MINDGDIVALALKQDWSEEELIGHLGEPIERTDSEDMGTCLVWQLPGGDRITAFFDQDLMYAYGRDVSGGN